VIAGRPVEILIFKELADRFTNRESRVPIANQFGLENNVNRRSHQHVESVQGLKRTAGSLKDLGNQPD
jgi:hypothetical protein